MNSKFSFYYKAPAEFIAESLALFARMTVQPTAKQKLTINTAIKALKTAGIWEKLDVFVMLHSHDVQAAYLNWIKASYNGLPTNSPVFTTFTGVMSGASKYISSFTPSGSTLYKTNDASIGIRTSTNLISANYDIVRGTTGAGTTSLQRKTVANEFRARINNDSANIIYINADVTGESSVGLHCADLKSNNAKLFKSGINRKENTYPSFNIPTTAILVAQNSPSNYQFYFFGASLTDQQHADLNTIINNYIANYTNE